MILGGGGPGVVEKTEAKVWDAVGLAKVGFYLSFAALFIALTWCTLDLRLFAIRELRPRLLARDNQIAQLLNTVDTTSKANASKIDVTLTNIRELTGDADDSLEQITNALLDDKFGLIPRATSLVDSLNATAMDADKATVTLNAEIAATGAEVRERLAPLSAALTDVDNLIKTAQAEIETNGNASAATLLALNKAIGDADTLVSDPDIKATIAHIDHSTESIDIALMPWRKKAALLKVILEKLLNASLTVVPLIFK